MTWSEKHCIGVEVVDEQHRSLFTAIDRIRSILRDNDYERSKRACGEMLTYLEKHVLQHFATEEGYMRSIGYAYYEQHKLQHDAITETLLRIKQEILESDFARDAVERLVGTMFSWLIYHTAEVDSYIVKAPPQVDRSNSAAVAMEQTILQIFPNLFQIRPELLNAAYQGGFLGNEVCCVTDCHHADGRKFRVLAAISDAVVLHVANRMFSSDLTEMDEMTCSAITELVAMLAIHFARNYQHGDSFLVSRTAIVPMDRLEEELPEGAPLCSLLFDDPFGSIYLRAWDISARTP